MNKTPFPALIPAIWLCLGILLYSVFGYNFNFFILVTFILGFASTLYFFKIQMWKQAFLFITIGFFLTLFHNERTENHYSKKFLYQEKQNAEVKLTIKSTDSSQDGLRIFKTSPTFEANMQAIRFSKNSPLIPCYGKTIVKIPFQFNHLKNFSFGNQLILKGFFSSVDKALFAEEFQYRQYLQHKNISHVFKVTELQSSSEPVWFDNLQLKLFELRDSLLINAVKHLKTLEQKKLMASMFMGYKSSLSYQDKQIYLKSGTLHLFAISGLHIGILASILLLFMKIIRIPYAVRYMILPFSLAIYVIMTGSPPSAVRAWVMLSVWSICKGNFLAMNGINNLAVAAIILLVWNPLNLFQTGFQFSFIIVSCLLAGFRLSTEIIKTLDEKNQWLPAGYKSPNTLTMLRNIFLNTLFCSLFAWLGSTGLTAYMNSLFLPISIFVNMIIGIYAWVILFFGLLSITGLSILSIPLIYCLDTVNFIAHAAAKSDFTYYINQPSFSIVILYYFLLFFILIMPLKRKSIKIFSSIFLCILFFSFSPFKKQEIIAFTDPGNNIPNIIIFQNNNPILINCTSRFAASKTSTLLKHRGYNQASYLILPEAKAAFSGGTAELLGNIKIGTLVLPQYWKRSKKLKEVNNLEIIVNKKNVQFSEFKDSLINYKKSKKSNSTSQYQIQVTTDKKTFNIIFTQQTFRKTHYSISVQKDKQIQKGKHIFAIQNKSEKYIFNW